MDLSEPGSIAVLVICSVQQLADYLIRVDDRDGKKILVKLQSVGVSMLKEKTSLRELSGDQGICMK